jgi:NAD-dependent dihydropyrimidine dehydrogenase PreA subunit
MTSNKALEAYAGKLGFPRSETLGRIFAVLFDGQDDLRILEALPGTAAEIARKTGLAEERVRRAADRLVNRGALAHPMKHPDLYRLFPAMIELRDATVLWPDAPQELFELWERLVTREMPGLVPVLEKLKIPPMIRVVPVERSVDSRNTVLDADSARKIFRDARLVTALPCACRLQARKNNRSPECPAPATAVCMQTNGFAEVVLSRGLGERLTNEEALKRIAEAEEAGLVHMVRNNIQEDMFMCNCCACCCTGLFLVNQTGYRDALAPSRFRVRLDAEACSGCGLCEERCQFHAIAVNGVAAVDLDKCYGCGNCVITCPEEALVLEEVRPLSHIRVK